MKGNEELQKCIKSLVSQELIIGKIDKVYSITGGSVNSAFGIETEYQNFFIKLNKRKRFPEMFSKEVKGLQQLENCKALRIPKVVYEGGIEDTAFLVLELIQVGDEKANYWEVLGEGLAGIHQHTRANFGLEYNNYNGSLIQVNHEKKTWEEFFVENRLAVQLKMAKDTQRIDTEFVQLFEKALNNLRGIFPEEQPALLHGDLWSGNFITDQEGMPVLIDPAVYYGNREVDIAMSMLFGGFHRKFYEAYNQAFPMKEGWESRVDVLNLYPLLVHVNLFGASYAQRVKSMLKKWV